jgi:hypothetical protein
LPPDHPHQTLYGRRPGACTSSSRPRRDFAGDSGVFKRCPFSGPSPQISLNAKASDKIRKSVRGGLEHRRKGNFPGSGKSCNKSNTSEVDVPGCTAECSLFSSLPGLYVAVRQVRASAAAPLAAAPTGTRQPGCAGRPSCLRCRAWDAHAGHRRAGARLAATWYSHSAHYIAGLSARFVPGLMGRR